LTLDRGAVDNVTVVAVRFDGDTPTTISPVTADGGIWR